MSEQKSFFEAFMAVNPKVAQLIDYDRYVTNGISSPQSSLKSLTGREIENLVSKLNLSGVTKIEAFKQINELKEQFAQRDFDKLMAQVKNELKVFEAEEAKKTPEEIIKDAHTISDYQNIEDMLENIGEDLFLGGSDKKQKVLTDLLSKNALKTIYDLGLGLDGAFYWQDYGYTYGRFILDYLEEYFPNHKEEASRDDE